MLGIAGGLGFLAAFVVDIPSGANTVRIVLFEAGAIAIASATYDRHAAVSRSLATLGAVPLIAANATAIAWIVLSTGRSSPFAGDFGLAGFWVSVAMWLADAWFGGVALRLGVVPRWTALALAAGSVLAILGIDRLGLTSSENPTILGTISLVGLALNAIAWVALGVDDLLRRAAR